MYPSASELVAASASAELQALTGDQQEGLRQQAIGAIERHCRQSFTVDGATGSGGDEAAPETVRVLDGSGQRTLYLPRRLSNFTAMSFNGSTRDISAFMLNTSRSRLSFRPPGEGMTWADKLDAELMDGGPTTEFPVEPDSVAITGVWGWTPEEYDAQLSAVTVALRLDMEDQAARAASSLAPTVDAARSLGLASVSQGDLTIDLTRRAPDVSGRVARTLAATTPMGERLIWPRGDGAGRVV